MGIFVYSPSIRVLIDSGVAKGTIDVSQDITAGEVSLRENGLHTMKLGLLNKQRKYDRVFSPNDRFAIYMKRVTEMLVMTGYLNTVPYVTAWQRTITLTGSCAAKRLAYHFWDPGSMAAFNLMVKNGNLGDEKTANDGGIASKVTAVLHDVCEVPYPEIHIGQIPTDWMRKITKLYNAVESQVGYYWASLGGSNTNGTNGNGSASTSATTSLGVPNRLDTPPGASLPTTMGGVTSKPPLTTGIQPIRDDWWVALQWPYRMDSLMGNINTPGIDKKKAGDWLAKRKLIVSNPNNNAAAVVYTVGWGPENPANQPNPPSMCVSKGLMKKLGLAEGQDAEVAWVKLDQEAKAKFGPVDPKDLPAQTTTTPVNTYTSGITGQVETVSVAGLNAANWAAKVCNANPPIPYVYGGTGPNGYDCSGLTGAAWKNGGKIEIPRTSEAQYQALLDKSLNAGNLQPGDLIFYEGIPPGHVTMFLGGGQMAEAPHTGTNLHVTPFRTGAVGYGRPSNADAIAGTTAIPAGSTAGTGTAADQTQPAQNLITEWDWFGNGPNPMSAILTGVRALMNDQPILPFIDMLVQTSMRSWCTAPNGDFIAWFPDYFGVYGTAGIMDITSVELKDFTIVWSDENLVTHQFVAGTYAPTAFGQQPGGPVGAGNMAQTMGIATVQSPLILQSLLNLSKEDMSPNGTGTDLAKKLLGRFGTRPQFTGMGTLAGHLAEFWYALYLFQKNWATQFNTVVPITFMPELYPGMLIRLAQFGFQAYVTGVTHSFNLTQGGGFSTDAYVIAPSATDKSGLIGLAKGGLRGLV